MSGTRAHRLFFALDPDEEVRNRTAAFQRSLGLEGRAVPPRNFHVTLAFLGMQPAEVIDEACAVASRLSFQPCAVVLDIPGSFKRAGVFWLGTQQLPGPLETFQHQLVSGLLDAGIGYDRKPWKFHLTLYRKMRKRPSIMPTVAIDWRLQGFSLIESVSVRSGVEYHTLAHWKARD